MWLGNQFSKMFGISILSKFSRLSLTNVLAVQSARNIATGNILNFHLTQELYAEPLKKKKRIDPQVIKAREERRKKKIEKQIRRLEKNARQLKPIDEIELPLSIVDTIKIRRRAPPVLSATEMEARALLQKDWSRYKLTEYMADVREIDRIMTSQQKALDELYKESEDLYEEAIACDMSLVPFTTTGPVATPPIKNYESPDGEYIDITKKWDN